MNQNSILGELKKCRPVFDQEGLESSSSRISKVSK